MCGIACLEGNFIPKLTQKHRPPKNGGWTISAIPDAALPDDEDRRNKIIWGWQSRRLVQNANALAAVNEMIQFLRLQDVPITKEIKKAITEAADLEWCRREPDRCPDMNVEEFIRPVGFGFPEAQPPGFQQQPCNRGCAGGRAR
jgi:hypothetical protein